MNDRSSRAPHQSEPRHANAAHLAWLVTDLVTRVNHCDHAVVLSSDGLLIARSDQLGLEDAEHLCAVAAGVHGLARSTGKRFGRGAVRQSIIEMRSGFLFVTAGGDGTALAVLASQEADVGLVAYEMAMLVVRVGEFLSSRPRAIATGTDSGRGTRP